LEVICLDCEEGWIYFVFISIHSWCQGRSHVGLAWCTGTRVKNNFLLLLATFLLLCTPLAHNCALDQHGSCKQRLKAIASPLTSNAQPIK
jgi:hypothetical protein